MCANAIPQHIDNANGMNTRQKRWRNIFVYARTHLIQAERNCSHIAKRNQRRRCNRTNVWLFIRSNGFLFFNVNVKCTNTCAPRICSFVQLNCKCADWAIDYFCVLHIDSHHSIGMERAQQMTHSTRTDTYTHIVHTIANSVLWNCIA